MWHWISIACALFLAGCDQSSPSDGSLLDISRPWEAIAPAQAGINGDMLSIAETSAAAIPRLNSLLTVYKGKIVQEAYFNGLSATALQDVRSITKSVVSTLVGASLETDLIPDLNETLGKLIPSEVAELEDNQRDISIRHLLTMTGGFAWNETTSDSYTQWIRSGDHLAYVLNQSLSDQPGNAFTYNSGAVHLLGVVMEETTGLELEVLADSLLFGPLGISERNWEDLSQGYVNAGSGIDLRTRDLARLGQLYLQNGVSGDHKLFASDWAATATAPRFDWRISLGPLQAVTYGYLWWIVTDQPEPAFFAWGFGGQFIYVVPDLSLIVVSTTNWSGITQEPGGVRGVEAAVMQVINQIVAAVR